MKEHHITSIEFLQMKKIYDFGLYLVDRILLESGKHLADFPLMPLWTGPQEGEVWETIPANFLLAQQIQYNIDELKATVERNCESFNAEQRNFFDANNKGKMLFIHSAGGCGKTFVCNTIAAAVRAQGKVALCVSSSGIAALLLHQENVNFLTNLIWSCYGLVP